MFSLFFFFIESSLYFLLEVAVSFNKIFAKLGSDMKKPDAVTEIRRDNFREKIWPLPASDLLYVGRATDAKLRTYCIQTIGDLANADVEMLKRIFGVHGQKIWIYANGLDVSRVMPCDYEVPIKSIGHGITCTSDLLTNEEVMHVFMELSQQVGQKLRKNNLAATRVRIFVRDNKLYSREYQGRLDYPTQCYTEIARAGYELFRRRYVWNNDIRSLTISGIDLVPADIPIQIDFFNDYEKHQRRLTLETTIDDIRRRFGTASINFASLTQGLKMPAHREIEYKMPSPMYQ